MNIPKWISSVFEAIFLLGGDNFYIASTSIERTPWDMKYSAFLIKLSALLLEVVVHLDLKLCVCTAYGSFTFIHAIFFFSAI